VIGQSNSNGADSRETGISVIRQSRMQATNSGWGEKSFLVKVFTSITFNLIMTVLGTELPFKFD
jgi:hypothetical protein